LRMRDVARKALTAVFQETYIRDISICMGGGNRHASVRSDVAALPADHGSMADQLFRRMAQGRNIHSIALERGYLIFVQKRRRPLLRAHSQTL
jgi:hypothetical protein